MGGGASRATQAKVQPKAPHAMPSAPVTRATAAAGGGGNAEEPTDYYLDHLDEVSDDGVGDDGGPDLRGMDANREEWEMVSASLGMEGDELLFNMM